MGAHSARPRGFVYFADPKPRIGTKIKLRKKSPYPNPGPFENAFAMSIAMISPMITFTSGMKKRITNHPGRPEILNNK